MPMFAIPNQPSVAEAIDDFDDAGRMKPSPCFDRVVDVMRCSTRSRSLRAGLAVSGSSRIGSSGIGSSGIGSSGRASAKRARRLCRLASTCRRFDAHAHLGHCRSQRLAGHCRRAFSDRLAARGANGHRDADPTSCEVVSAWLTIGTGRGFPSNRKSATTERACRRSRRRSNRVYAFG